MMSEDRKWLFYYESRLNDYQFIIHAVNSVQAYMKAFEAYGPQVQEMMYKEIKS